MKCSGCGLSMQSGFHEYCHIKYDSPKTYDQYLEELKERQDSIMSKYGAPSFAQPPGVKPKILLEKISYET